MTKKITKKLVLAKVTIASLNRDQMDFALGGELTDLCPPPHTQGNVSACADSCHIRACESHVDTPSVCACSGACSKTWICVTDRVAC